MDKIRNDDDRRAPDAGPDPDRRSIGPDLTELREESLRVTRDRYTTLSTALAAQGHRESKRCPDCGLIEGHLFRCAPGGAS